MPDAVDVPSFFTTDPNAAGVLTYPQLEARRRIAMALAIRNRPYPKTIGEGLTALGEGIGEGYVNRGLERAEAAQQAADAKLRGGMYPAVPAPAAPAAPGPTSEIPSDNVLASYTGGVSETGEPVKLAMATDQPLLTEEPTTQKPVGMSNEEWKQRIARNESGFRKDAYTLVGERSRRGDYPYGKFQVMGENVPKWTKQFVGREMTPQEFLLDPKAQETVADGQGGKYRAKYGDEGAAAAWFAGEKGMNDPNRKDTLGTHVAEYRRRFNMPLVSRDQVAASAARTAPTLPGGQDEAGMAMAYAPEDGTAPRDVPTIWDQTATGYRQTAADAPVRLASLGGGVPTSDAEPSDPRAAITEKLAGPPPQQVAAGPAPLPQAPTTPAPLPPAQPPTPPALQRPAADPQPEDPGVRPKLETYTNDPKRRGMINAAMQAYHSNFATPQLRAEAEERLKRLYSEANDEYTKDFTVWHEKDTVKRAWELKARDRQIAEETHRQAQQGTITGQEVRQPVNPAILGTPQSPQRTGIPSPDPKPAGVTESAHAAEQQKKMAAVVEAVDKGEHALQQSLQLINLAKTHPGRAWGLGAPGSYLRESPWAGDAYAFGALNKQLTSKNFMAGYQDLRGAGAIGVKEGEKAEQAQGNIDPNMKKEHYDAALQRLEDSLRSQIEVAQRKANRPVTAWGNGPNDKPAPDIGQPGTRNGVDVIYIGGNPADDASYKRVR